MHRAPFILAAACLLAGCETYRTFDLPRASGGSLDSLRAD